MIIIVYIMEYIYGGSSDQLYILCCYIITADTQYYCYTVIGIS